jgi:hypothetical protein
MRICNLFISPVHDGLLDPKLTFSTDEVNVNLSGCVNSQKNRYWSSEGPRALIQVPLYGQKTGIWLSIGADGVIGPIYYEGNLDEVRYINEILNPFFISLTHAEERFGDLMQDGGTQNTHTHTHTHTNTHARTHTHTLTITI